MDEKKTWVNPCSVTFSSGPNTVLNILGFLGHMVSITTTQLCRYGRSYRKYVKETCLCSSKILFTKKKKQTGFGSCFTDSYYKMRTKSILLLSISIFNFPLRLLKSHSPSCQLPLILSVPIVCIISCYLLK